MSATAGLDRSQAAEFLAGLRRDISAARLRVTLDEKLGRHTPRAVKELAALPEPPSVGPEERVAGGHIAVQFLEGATLADSDRVGLYTPNTAVERVRIDTEARDPHETSFDQELRSGSHRRNE